MIKIIGTGSYLPDKILTNHELSKMVDTSDEWISKRTGIKERRIASNMEATSDLGAKAARIAIEKAGISLDDIDLIIVGTSTPDYPIPAVAPIIQRKLGCSKAFAFDLNSVCTSFAAAFINAYALLATGLYKTAVVIGADTYSRILNWKDRATCVLFGDGAGAFVIQRDSNKRGVLSHFYASDGNGADAIIIPSGGSRNPLSKVSEYKYEDLFFQMDGKRVYEFTIEKIPDTADLLIKKANIKANDLKWVALHQANMRIIDTVSKRLSIATDKFLVNIDKVGNTSSASIPIVIDEAVQKGLIREGDIILMLGFGGGLSWGGVVFEW